MKCPISVKEAKAPARRFARPGLLAALALLVTALNALKPLHVDDTAYYYFARHLAERPLDPYDFELFWYQEPNTANDILAPLVVPAWWSFALRLFGERPVLWKLWMFPFVLLFVGALHTLFRRFARGRELPLTAMTALSPLFLPSWNLMLDVPALALGLAGFVTYLRATDRGSWRQALVAGLLLGLAMQTKYTALLFPALVGLHALVVRRGASARRAAASVAVAVLVFAGWEAFLLLRTGSSHFGHHAQDGTGGWRSKILLVVPLLTMLGGLGAVLVPWGVRVLQAPQGAMAAGCALTAGAYLAAAWLEPTIFLIPGLLLVGIMAGAGARLVRSARGRRTRVEWFLVAWLLLEVAGYLVLTPFPAARRVMGVYVVAVVLLGRLAVQTRLAPGILRGLVVAQILLGLAYYGVDFLDAYAWREAALRASRVAAPRPGQTVWYVGHWGFQYYAEREGMRPVVPGRSVIRPGDWLVLPDARLNQQKIGLDEARTVERDRLEVFEVPWVPVRTVQCFYGGFAPLEPHRGPRVTVSVYEVTGEFVP